MFVISFQKNRIIGGFGDRIVGLISVKLISKLLNKDFYILWDKENIKEYFDYDKYDYDRISSEIPKMIKSGNDIKLNNCIDEQKSFKKYLMNTNNIEEFFPHTINYFEVNMEISQYLYKNKLFENRNFLNDIFEEYSKLYTDIFKPTDYLMNKINSLTLNKNNIVGIQIRCGDCYMITNRNERHKTNNHENVGEKLVNIRKICNEKYGNDYYVFFTTDNIGLLNYVVRTFNKSQIIYNTDIIQHLDRKSVNSDISKIFVDSYILSQKTDLLFVSFNSNFGRIAGLSCNHNNIYNFVDNTKINKKDLLSKEEMLF